MIPKTFVRFAPSVLTTLLAATLATTASAQWPWDPNGGCLNTCNSPGVCTAKLPIYVFSKHDCETFQGQDFHNNKNYDQCSFNWTNWVDANMRNTQLRNTYFSNSLMRRVNLNGCDMTNSHFPSADLQSADMRSVQGDYCDFRHSKVGYSSATGSTFRYSSFYYAWMDEADFSYCDFDEAEFAACDAFKTNFEGCIMTAADMTGGRFKGANFRGANLSKAIVTKADFSGADLTDVIGLSTTKGFAVFDCNTKFPAGFKPREYGWYVNPFKACHSVAHISISEGGSQEIEFGAGEIYGGFTYMLLGSASGTTPGLPLMGIGLNPDLYTTYTIVNANNAILSDSYGVLDNDGMAYASIDLAPDQIGWWYAGLELHHAFVMFDHEMNVMEATNSVSLILEP